jgi:hypothetical protein
MFDVVMPLFDDTTRTYDGPADYREPHFHYLNRSARIDITRLRLEVDLWFRRYPSEHSSDLRARFRSSDNVQYGGAFFELFLHEFLLRLSCSIEIHPEMPGTTRRPEFKVTSSDGGQFYLEARVVTDESKDAAAARQRQNAAYDAINDLDSPDYWINVEVYGLPDSAVPTRKLKQFIKTELAKLVYDDVVYRYEKLGLGGLPRWRFQFGDWTMILFPLPKQTARGKVGVRPLGVQMSAPRSIDPVTPIRDAILEKAKRYGTPDLPFVVAINALSDFLNEEKIIEALFGSDAWVLRLGGSDLEFQRQLDGVWTSPAGQYRRISAVLAFKKVDIWNYRDAFVRLYHHHSPTLKLTGPLSRLPQAVARDGRLEFVEGESLAQIFSASAQEQGY